jgi:Animal haem peroxidase
MRSIMATIVAAGLIGVAATRDARAEDDLAVFLACQRAFADPIRLPAADRTGRFLGKVSDFQARCRGGEKAVAAMGNPWVDWSNYWSIGDAASKSDRIDAGFPVVGRNRRGLNGAFLDLELQRLELMKFNLFDNNGTFEQYVNGDGTGVDGAALKTWPQMRLPAGHPNIGDMGVGPDGAQTCKGELIRYRTLTGICNDMRNPAMGSTGQLFARNVAFESTFPDLANDPTARARHGGRISLLKPDPQVISRRLFTRDQTQGRNCNQGRGTPDGDADCAYKKAPFFNVLAAFWIQFMTHDWFSHLEEGRNDTSRMLPSLGCASARVNNVEQPLSADDIAKLGCRPDDKMETALIADDTAPGTFAANGSDHLRRAYKTTRNNTTAWWDASQIYGYDERSRQRLRRDPADAAKFAMTPAHTGGGEGDKYGYLPVFRPACAPGIAADQCDPIQPEWAGQEAAAFPDNWSIGVSFYTNLFVREHNIIVDAFRALQKTTPDADSGLRDPERPTQAIAYGQISDQQLFEIARLIVAAEIAKIHTIEWTTQLLYNEPLNIGMHSNWSGLLGEDDQVLKKTLQDIMKGLVNSPRANEANQLFSVFAQGAGIVGRGAAGRFPDEINDGPNHFGSPFNFPEEFISVYRLHPLVPDLLEFRDLAKDPNAIVKKIAVIDTFRGKATAKMDGGGLANWALTMGRQRLGTLSLRNMPQFLQNLDLRPRLDTKIDIPALDIIRDRERGIPRFNEFRRQIGLRQLTSFDDFIDHGPGVGAADRAEQQNLVKTLREVYGTHPCDASKVITTAQLDPSGKPINDCLGHPDGSTVDNIEDVDIVVGFLAETTRPHGYAISETQFHIFIINASRRLFSDRFFTSSFRPEFYTQFGLDWVMNNGPGDKQWEEGEPNGHKQEVTPLKRVLLRAMPELAGELAHVVNAFDPWARDRGQYYSLDWKPRPDAASDPAFKGP